MTSAILLLLITLSGLTYYVLEANNLGRNSIITLSEIYERYSKRLSLGLQLVNLYVNGSDVVAVVYNYGDEDVRVVNVFHPLRNYTIYVYNDGALNETHIIEPKTLALIVFHNSSLKDFSPIILEVENCGIYEISL